MSKQTVKTICIDILIWALIISGFIFHNEAAANVALFFIWGGIVFGFIACALLSLSDDFDFLRKVVSKWEARPQGLAKYSRLSILLKASALAGAGLFFVAAVYAVASLAYNVGFDIARDRIDEQEART